MADSAGAEPKVKGSVAILVDGENVRHDLADQVIKRSLDIGDPAVKRVYGNAAKMPKWDAAPGFKLVHSGSGKNATDMLLVIEAMALSYEAKVDTIVIVSSDRDFTHLAHHLRERQITVVGMGEEKTSESFRKACSEFVELHLTGSDDRPKAELPLQDNKSQTLEDKVVALIKTEGKDSSLAMSSLGGRMNALHKIQISSHVDKTWRAYLVARPNLFRCDEKGPNARVHLTSR